MLKDGIFTAGGGAGKLEDGSAILVETGPGLVEGILTTTFVAEIELLGGLKPTIKETLALVGRPLEVDGGLYEKPTCVVVIILVNAGTLVFTDFSSRNQDTGPSV